MPFICTSGSIDSTILVSFKTNNVDSTLRKSDVGKILLKLQVTAGRPRARYCLTYIPV